ncbi:response regulator [Sediminitomix flava]|uniref:LuxR family two component transcriptional regulator n=1 Tax=Sediminitomix flava TaxID=379075 RepID=A0A315Z5B3_SEDFL|nr:response regulator transcription factor [Sediminitomix flava]PWJ38005.1 LuxR family two component transcriptional regulator [Sediminitomix flava]
MIRVLLVEDHQLFAEGLKSMFKVQDGIEITQHTVNGYQVPSLLVEHPIDIILLDIDMPIINGVEVLKLLNEKGIDTPVLMLTMHQSINHIRKALEKGANGYIMKDASKPELVEAIEKTSQKQSYFHPQISEQVFDYFRNKNKSTESLNGLSEREIEIIECLTEGLNSRMIAEKLFISEHTVRTHRRNIMHKLNVKSATALVRYAIENELVNGN